MAAPTARNVAAAQPRVGGGIYYAPLGTALPTNESSALAAAYIPLGLISEEGLRPARDTSVQKKKAWGGDVVAQLLTDESTNFEFTLLELFSGDVNKFVYGTANVTVTAAAVGTGTKTAILDKGGKPAQCVLVFDMRYGGKQMRLVVPVADSVITEEGAYVDSDLAGTYTVASEAIKDTAGVRVYRYLANDDGL